MNLLAFLFSGIQHKPGYIIFAINYYSTKSTKAQSFAHDYITKTLQSFSLTLSDELQAVLIALLLLLELVPLSSVAIDLWYRQCSAQAHSSDSQLQHHCRHKGVAQLTRKNKNSANERSESINAYWKRTWTIFNESPYFLADTVRYLICSALFALILHNIPTSTDTLRPFNNKENGPVKNHKINIL